ncbi:hypothetical protein C8R47DRAFT_1081370 [Mycena vitilis]|nr:hypothetical protein C8R47DRAFT_1081370 [Mycena vitilis]
MGEPQEQRLEAGTRDVSRGRYGEGGKMKKAQNRQTGAIRQQGVECVPVEVIADVRDNRAAMSIQSKEVQIDRTAEGPGVVRSNQRTGSTDGSADGQWGSGTKESNMSSSYSKHKDRRAGVGRGEHVESVKDSQRLDNGVKTPSSESILENISDGGDNCSSSSSRSKDSRICTKEEGDRCPTTERKPSTVTRVSIFKLHQKEESKRINV